MLRWNWWRGQVAAEAEQRRLFPWLAVAFGAGVLACFTLTDGVPSLAAPLLATAACAMTLPLLGERPVARAVVFAIVAAFLGFAATTYRMKAIAGPVLSRVTIGPLLGRVESVEEREDGARIIVRVERFAALPAEMTPVRVRLTVKGTGPAPGTAIAATARLLPPPEAARPGGYDFARDAYFRGIGAVGSVLGAVTVREAGPAPLQLRVAAAVDTARNVLTRRIADATGGPAGAVAAALVTGKRGLIDPTTNDVLRAAGIYHVVSISGLHMVLAAGVVFWLVRALLASVPTVALQWPVKKIAALAAMAGVTAYCAFSGWDVAAERALVMTLVMLGAVLFDRPALSMRNLALAAILALAREPEALLGPSFQMSFGAVAGLIACAGWLGGSWFRLEGRGPIARAWRWVTVAVVGTLGTTLVAQVATAPFALYHFNAVQPFGLVGNALTLPLVSLAVMPAAVLGILAYPFALDTPVWWLMGQAVAAMLAISARIAALGHANHVVPSFGPTALILFATALVVATLPVSRLRLLALLPCLGGIALAASPQRVDILIDRDAAGAAVRGTDGRFVILGRPPNFVAEQWLRADGDPRKAEDARAGATCDRLGCTAQLAVAGTASVDVAWVKDRRAFPEDCGRAAVIVARVPPPAACAARLVIDRSSLARTGALALHVRDGAYIAVGARGTGARPPWRAQPLPTEQRKPQIAKSEIVPEDTVDADDMLRLDPL